MKKLVFFVGVGFFFGSTVFAFQLPIPKIPKLGGESGGPSVPSVPGGVPSAGGDRDAVLNPLKQCCNEVRYSDTVEATPKQAIAKMQNCINQVGGSWEQDQVGPTTLSGLVKKWWQKGFMGPDTCLTVNLQCSNSGDAQQVCTSCTVVPSKGIKSYCEPIHR